MDLIDLIKLDDLDNIYIDNNDLQSLKIYFNSNEIKEELIINDNIYNLSDFQEIKSDKILLLSFNLIFQKLNILDNSKYIFYVKTNYNNSIRIYSDYKHEDTYYTLFDGFANILNKNYNLDVIHKNNISLIDKYLYVYFYRNKHINYLNNDKFLINYNNYICLNDFELCKFIIFNSSNKYNKYNKYNDQNRYLLNINIYEKNNNPFDIQCIVNILINYDNTFMIILSPIKIIVNFDNHFIDFYDKSCEKCNHNKYNKKDNLLFMKYLMMCNKHSRKLENNIKNIFNSFDYCNIYELNIDEIKLQLLNELNIDIDISSCNVYS